MEVGQEEAHLPGHVEEGEDGAKCPPPPLDPLRTLVSWILPSATSVPV